MRNISFARFKICLQVGGGGRSAIRAEVICGFEHWDEYGEEAEEAEGGGLSGGADARIVDGDDGE